ncbi:GyrI-like domain-containing protein [Rummeliibacillus pycnus]|uniref:GyrI-like domain-containing protein n=1 Tax=Rummeliibacillus pycnus TaxID=101070 RepID=UPI003D28A9E0
MFARFEEIEGFIVKGFSVQNGAWGDIPVQWNKLEQEIDKLNKRPKITYGVCVSMGDEGLHYVAGLVSNAVKGIRVPDQVLVSAGRYLVGIVEHGIEDIPASLEALLNVKGINFRHAPCFEKYLFYDEAENNEIELWVPIE